MKKSTYLFSIVLLFVFGLMACQQQPKNVTAEISADSAALPDINKEITILCKDNKLVGPPERGAKVAYHLAEKCFKEYERVMYKHCFLSDTAEVRRGNATMPGSTNKCRVDSFRMITHSESFLGTDMMCWLAANSLLAPDTSKIVTEFRMGIYTKEFVEGADTAYKNISPDELSERIGRTTIFLVPYTKNGKNRIPPKDVYDFGGLQP